MLLRCRDSQPNDIQPNDTVHKNLKNVKHSILEHSVTIKLTMLSAIILIVIMLRGVASMLIMKQHTL
jgi:hypothetical protein